VLKGDDEHPMPFAFTGKPSKLTSTPVSPAEDSPPQPRERDMRGLFVRSRFVIAAACGFAVVALGGCGSVQVSDRHPYEGARLSRPDRIIVYDFAATPGDLPAWSDAGSRYAGSRTRSSENELATGRKLGVQMAQELVRKIDAMGLPAVRAQGQAAPADGDIAIVGYFTSVDKGSAAERIAIGFGEGAAELSTVVEGYLATGEGMRRLGSGTVSSKAEKTPGVLLPLAVTVATANPIGLAVGGAVKVGEEASGKSTVEGVAASVADRIADELRVKFREQGWIE